MNSAIFLDRDGVIIENRANYVRSWRDVTIYPQALQALAAISHSPHKILIVTNQSAVGRGIISLRTARAINTALVEVIGAKGGRIDGVYMCPHAPSDNCACRKPEAGLLLTAAAEHNLDFKQSIMIGDALTDLRAGWAAGVGQVALLLTGRGAVQAELPERAAYPPFPIYATLQEALVAWLHE